MSRARDLAAGTFSGAFSADSPTLVVDDTNNRVGVGTASPSAALHVYNSGGGIVGLVEAASGYNARMRIQSGNANESFLEFADPDDSDVGEIVYDHSSNSMRFNTNATEAMRIDSSGNLLVGKTAIGISSVGGELRADGQVTGTKDGGAALALNRKTSDGDIAVFQKDGSTVGSIASGGGRLAIGDATVGLRFVDASTARISPWNLSTQADRDNAVDLGESSARFDDIYATNATIQTSDLTLKTAIASLTDAEITAAKAISKLFKTFKWNDAVEAKGDNARTHTGVIAQDVQQAMTDAGLDAGNYAFFISSTWWETQTEVPAVDEVVDEDGNVITEAKEAYTRTDTYDTLEEAPEGATERTRLGIRYPELLAFIGAATEQRLTSIEARLAALETA